MLQLEKAYLLCNAWPTTARTNIYNVTKGEIDKKDIDVVFECFVLDGPDVDKRARDILAFTNEADAVYNTYKKHDGDLKGAFTGSDELANVKTISNGGVGSQQIDRVIHLGSQEMADNKGKVNQSFSYTATNDNSKIATYMSDNTAKSTPSESK
jgi:hypothetical protein